MGAGETPQWVFSIGTHRVVSGAVLTEDLSQFESDLPIQLTSGGRQAVRAIPGCPAFPHPSRMRLLGVLGTYTLQPNYQPELIKGIPNCTSDASQECP